MCDLDREESVRVGQGRRGIYLQPCSDISGPGTRIRMYT